MKKTGKWILATLSRSLAFLLAAFLLPFVKPLFGRLFPGVTGEIQIQSRIIEQKLESSSRLEVTNIEEEGLLEAKTNVIILGTVGTTVIKYRYTASIGIDLSRVIMTTDSERIGFILPEPEILNDGIEALQIDKHDLFSRAVDKSTETLLSEQKEKCRIQYLTDEKKSQRIWEDTVKAFEKTICEWLETYGERHYQFEFIRQSDIPQEVAC